MNPDAIAFDTPSQFLVIPLRTKRNGIAPSPVARHVTAAAAVTVQTLTCTPRAFTHATQAASGPTRKSLRGRNIFSDRRLV
jgi:hypothetical protein